ncbi:MAG TPA: ribosome silencing factor [Candidatus Binatia bacterium]|nr:ribosome silencing factor [Candidatus Binatia bacterium]
MKLDKSWEKALRSAQAALDKKAYDLVVLQVGALTSVADYFVICTGRSDVQVQSICRAIEESMATVGVKPLAIEGFTHGQWVLLDFGDVVIHVFYETVRQFYNLEGLWVQAPRCALPEPYSTQARDLRIATA